MKRRLLLLLLLLGSWLGLSTAQAQTILARESFESATNPANSASSFGYTSFAQNYFDDRANTVQFFQRSSLPVSGFNTANGFVFGTGIDGSWLVAGEAVRGQVGGAPTRDARFVQLNGINIASKSSIQVLVSFADARGLGSGATIGQATNNWENDDFVRIKARVNGGAWVLIGQLVGDNPAGGGGGRLRQDTNLNGISSDDLSAPAVGSSFQDFTFNLTGSGSTLDVMVEVDANGGSEELGLDNVRVLGTASATAPPVLANIETTSLNYNEGDPATQITSAVTVSDADSPNLTGGSVTLTTGFVSAQDRLLFTNQNGISGAYNTGTGVLTLVGTASLAAYQAALRSVRYQNIETVTAIGGLRLATFTVTDGTATSAASRNIIVTAQLNAPAALPYTEEFETDGEGLRYASNTWSTSNPCLGFLRTNANPYSCTPTTFGGISGSYYWYAEGTRNGANPNPINIGTLVLAPVNATNIGSLHFNVRLGIGEGTPPGLQWEIDDYVKFFYRVNGGAWVLFGAYVGDGPTTATSGNLRRDANLDGVADPGGTILTTTLQNTDFALPTSVTGASVDFMIEVGSDGQEELAMDRIVVTGTPATTVNSLVRASANPTNAATVSYTVTFGAPVTGLTASNFSLTTSGISGATVGTPVSTGTGSTWTVPVTTGTGSGTLTLNLANDTNLSTDITNTLPFAGETYTIDKTAPTVSSVSVPANGTYRTAQTLSFTVNFSEAVTVTGTPQLGLTLDTGGSVPANYASGSGTAALVFSYPIVAGNADGNGIAVGTLALNGGTIRDAVANNATLTLNGVPATTGVLVDGIAPVVSSINRQTPTTATTNATSLTYRVTFSEAVAGVTANDFGLTNTGTANGTISAVAAVSTSVYDVTVSGVSGNGTVRLDLNSSGTSITDTPAGNAIGGGYTSGQPYTLDQTAPTATLSSTTGASGTTTPTTPFSFTVTFSEAVSGFATSGLTIANGSVTSGPAGTSPGTTFTFTVTPTTAGTATMVAIVAGAAQDAAGNGNTASATYSLTYNLPTATVTSISKLMPTAAQSATGTATASVSFTVTFSASVSGVSTSNFNLTTAGITGAGVTSVAGSGATYTVTVNTGTGNGTLQLNVANAAGITPTITNTPFNGTSAGYIIFKNFSAGPQLSLRAASSASGANSDVTAFVDGVQVVQSGTSTAVANALQNGSFETNNLGASDYLYPATGLVAAPWAFTSQAGVSRIGGSGFAPAASGLGSFVGLLQSTSGGNGTIAQSLAVPTGTYQVNFVAAQRSNQGISDQVVNVFLNNGTNDVFVGTIQPGSTTTYGSFTSAAFTVTAPALTATLSTTASSPTSTAPIPFSVSFSQSVGTTFTASDVTVTGGTLNTASFGGSGAGPYTFTVTPTSSGSTVAVSLAAGVANDANNTGNAASNTVSVQYQQAVTAAPVLTSPANGATTNGLPTFAGTAPAGSTVTIYLTPNGGTAQNIGTATATGGSFSLPPATALASGTYSVYATAQSNGAAVSATSNTNTFTVDATAPTVVSINRQSPAANPTNATALTYRVTFSEAVTGVTTNDFSLTGTGTASGTASAVTAVSASVYDVMVSSASGSGTLRLDLNGTGTGIADLTGNNIGGGYTSGQAYTLDNSAPTATISSSAGASGGTTGTTPIPFTVMFSKSVTGFSAAGITVTNGTVGPISGSGPYTFSVTPTTAGTATTVTIAANAVQDAAGNGNTASASYSLTYVAPVTATTWMGVISPDWFTAANWTAGVPTTTIDATIPNGTIFSPAIGAGTATTRSLTVNSGATLSMSGGTLDVRGNLTSNGTLLPIGGTVVLGTTASSNGPNILGSSRVRFWNLTVNANGVLLSTSAGASVRRLLTLNGAFVTQNNAFVLESDATGTALVVNTNSAGFVFGPATVQRYIDASGNTGTSGYRHYASPVSGATVSSLSTSAYGGSFTAQVNSAYNTADPNQLTLATYPNVFGYDESKIAGSPAVSFSDFDKGYQSPLTLGDALTVGRGYAVQIGNLEKVQFTGPLNNNTQTISGLTYAATSTAGAASAGWALVGNPYPAPLDWRTVGAATGSSLSSVDGAAYVFQSTSAYAGRYTSFTNNVGAGTGLIASGQGFFVHASTPGTTGSITLNNNNRVTTYANPAFQRPTAETRPLLRLSLGLGNQPATVATAQDETFVYFETGASDGFDGRFDAYKLANPSGYYLGSATPGSSPLGLSIDGRSPLAVATTTEIPLWVSLPAGAYTLTATELLNFATLAGGTTVQLRDALLGTLTDLATTPSYSFSVAANAAYAGRFSLVFRTSGVLATQPGTELAQAKTSLYPNPTLSATTLSVTNLPKAITSLQVEVLDVLGRVVSHYTLPVQAGSAHQSLATDQLAGTLYLLRLTALAAQGQVQGTLPTQRLTLSH